MNEHSRIPVAIITGCSSGIGRATALLLAERGWRVFATARRPETLSAIASDRITPLRLDVTDEASMVAAVEQVSAQAGRIDALVNNADYTEVGPLEEAGADEIRLQFETDTFGPLRLAQLVLPAMRAQRSGRIINVSSGGGRIATAFTGLYCSSKFALEAMSDALRMETRQFGVNVILIEPGFARTNQYSDIARRIQYLSTNTSSPYHHSYEALNRLFSRSAAHSALAETVAKVIQHALTTERPRARYAATPDARIMLTILPLLSDTMRDALWSRMLGLRTLVASRQ